MTDNPRKFKCRFFGEVCTQRDCTETRCIAELKSNVQERTKRDAMTAGREAEIEVVATDLVAACAALGHQLNRVDIVRMMKLVKEPPSSFARRALAAVKAQLKKGQTNG